MMTATTEELIARERVAFVLYKQAHPESVAESFETVGLPIVLEFRERADAVLAALAIPATGEVEWSVRQSDGEVVKFSRERQARQYANDVSTVTHRGGAVTEHPRTLVKRTVGPWVEVTP